MNTETIFTGNTKPPTVLKHSQSVFSYGDFSRHFPFFFALMKRRCERLTLEQIRICAYIGIGLTNEEVAEIRGVSKKSMEQALYRIRKKLIIPATISLSTIIHQIMLDSRGQ